MITSPCGYKRAKEQNRLLTGMEKCASGVNSQAAAHPRIATLWHVRLPYVPGISL